MKEYLLRVTAGTQLGAQLRTYILKVLAIDPGALRQGYACITKGNNGRFTLLFSGYDGLVRGDDEAYQAYRMRLVNYWVENFRSILHQANVRGEKCMPYIV